MRALSSFIICALLLQLCLLNISCQKEYSFEGDIPIASSGTAVYTLDGDGGNCTSPVINGTYATGNALQPTNSVQLRVNVTSVGTYILSTGTNNGIEFSASGSFTATGPQTITLTGMGIPLATGVFPFTPQVGQGCTFFITVTAAPPQIATYTLVGDPGGCSNFQVTGVCTAGVALRINNTVVVMANVTGIGSYTIHTDTVDGISFSQSGIFAATGIQKVILQGNGTPTNPGNLIFTCNTGSSICSFYLAALTPGPPATYVLESDQDSTCTGYSISGMFHSGIALLHTNNMAVKVTVTVLGNFTISTDTVNGMVFSFTGTFVSLGSQVVILTGSGTPVNSGTFRFIPQIVGPHPIGGEICVSHVTVM